jgi:NAD(P)H-hydrate epimerase
MQLLATAEQMQRYDRTAINAYTIPGLLLMENAGRAFVESLVDVAGPLGGKTVAVVCGKGNNGGDGFVIARHLLNRGCSVHVVLLGQRAQVRGDARVNLKSVERLAKERRSKLRFREMKSARALSSLHKPDIIVDALFGTGFSGSVRGLQQRGIEWINAQRSFVAAVDIASGVDASSGSVGNVAVRANLTVTMGLAKVGHYVGRGCDHSGNVVIADISIPEFVFRPEREQVYRVLGSDPAGVLPVRPRTAHKYNVGKVFVLAGSRSFTGAPAMCAESALRAGAGAVVLGSPRSIHPVLARKLTEVIVIPLEETGEGTVSSASRDEIDRRIGWADVVVVGPGMSRHPETDNFIVETVTRCPKPLVLDADGLNALGAHPLFLRRRKSPTVLTPHAGELARLTQDESTSIEADRISAARNAAKRFRSVLALKGAPTITADPKGIAFVNSTGNPGMATIGSGDVLTGLVAGLWAQGMSPAGATYTGVFLHGLAGDLAARTYGEKSLLATDICKYLPEAFGAAGRR